MFPTLSEGIVNILEKNQGNDFRNFLANKSSIENWLFTADFCFEPSFNNKTYAITVMPVTKPVESIVDLIQLKMPQDIKNVRSLSSEAIDLIRCNDYFHFAFVVNDPVTVVSEGSADPRASILYNIAELCDQILKTDATKEFLKPFKLLREASKAKGYSLTRHCNLMIFSSIISGIVSFVSKYVNIKRAGIFPDRDILTDLHDGIYIELIRASIIGHYHLNHRGSIPFYLSRGLPNSTGKKMWYDELVRFPDYIANFVAKWDMANIPETNEKSSLIFYDAFVDSNNIALINVRHDTRLYIDSVKANLKAG